MAFSRFASTDTVNDTARLTTSTWTGNTNELTTAFTASSQAGDTSRSTPTGRGAHYIEVYNLATSSADSEIQYSVAYGHNAGSGSEDFTNGAGGYGLSPSRNIYSQYRQLVYGTETQNFNFTDYTPNDIYVINVNRSRYKHNLKPGSLNLQLRSASIKLHLTDDSVTAIGASTTTNAGRQFNIVSGSDGVRSGSSNVQVTDSGSYGFFYPDSGLIILNPEALNYHLAGGGTSSLIPNVSQNTQGDNHVKLRNAINDGNSFILDSEEKVSSTYYFARARNNEFNYTTNPSFIDDNGNVLLNSMIDNPTVYITTVGLYGDNGDLLAVAKLSQPITKDFTKEALIRVKLDY